MQKMLRKEGCKKKSSDCSHPPLALLHGIRHSCLFLFPQTQVREKEGTKPRGKREKGRMELKGREGEGKGKGFYFKMSQKNPEIPTSPSRSPLPLTSLAVSLPPTLNKIWAKKRTRKNTRKTLELKPKKKYRRRAQFPFYPAKKK